MAEKMNDNSLRILTLNIEDCLGCESEHFKFPLDQNVHMLLYKLSPVNEASKTSNTITPIGQALQLLCTMEYATAESLQRMSQLKIGKGSLSMSFILKLVGGIGAGYDPESDSELDLEPSTSQQAQERREMRRKQKKLTYHVNAVRRFDDVHILDRIMFQVNQGDWRQLPVGEFHSLFFVQPQHRSDLLHDFYMLCANNWLKIIHADQFSYSNLRGDSNPFETFAKLFENETCAEKTLLNSLTTKCLEANETTRLGERRFVLNIFERVRIIFEYITINEYTVWFFVPRLNRYKELGHVNVEDFDLSRVRTCIKLANDDSNYYWHHADHNIMDILLVSFQLALAFLSKQSILFLGHLEKLAEFICLQYVKASFLNSVYASSEATSNQWVCSRYLQRIIELCESMNLLVFLEYPCGLTLLPEDREVIKCIEKRDEITGNISWNLFIDASKKSDSGLQHLKEAVNMN